jgi:hypothetical protein
MVSDEPQLAHFQLLKQRRNTNLKIRFCSDVRNQIDVILWSNVRVQSVHVRHVYHFISTLKLL